MSVVVLAGFAQPRWGNSSRDGMTAVEYAWDARGCIPPLAELDKTYSQEEQLKKCFPILRTGFIIQPKENDQTFTVRAVKNQHENNNFPK